MKTSGCWRKKLESRITANYTEGVCGVAQGLAKGGSLHEDRRGAKFWQGDTRPEKRMVLESAWVLRDQWEILSVSKFLLIECIRRCCSSGGCKRPWKLMNSGQAGSGPGSAVGESTKQALMNAPTSWSGSRIQTSWLQRKLV